MCSNNNRRLRGHAFERELGSWRKGWEERHDVNMVLIYEILKKYRKKEHKKSSGALLGRSSFKLPSTHPFMGL